MGEKWIYYAFPKYQLFPLNPYQKIQGKAKCNIEEIQENLLFFLVFGIWEDVTGPLRNLIKLSVDLFSRIREWTKDIEDKFLWNLSGMSQRHRFLLLHMRKSFVYWHFPEMSLPMKSRNHFNFFAPKNCRILFKPIIFVYSCKQSETFNMAYSQSTI